MLPKPRKILCRRVSAPSVQYVPVHKAENSGRKRVQLGRAHKGPVGARGGARGRKGCEARTSPNEPNRMFRTRREKRKVVSYRRYGLSVRPVQPHSANYGNPEKRHCRRRSKHIISPSKRWAIRKRN